MLDSPGRFSWTAIVSATFLIALFVSLFYLPLRPTAWGGPRGSGPFEEGTMPAAGRWARDVRIKLEALANSRSPEQPLAAMAEALVGYHALLVAAKLAVLWCVFFWLGRRGWLATLFTVAVALPMFLGAPRQTDRDVGLLLFAILLGGTTYSRPPWWWTALALPALFAFWANAHASALLGLVWLGVITLGRSVEWWKAAESSSRPAVLRLLISIVLCAAAMCANPDGPRIFVDAALAAKNANISSLPDYQPIDFNPQTLVPWIYLGTLALLILVQLIGTRPFSPTTLIVVLTFGFWPLVQQRGLDYWWLVVAWLIVPEIAAALSARSVSKGGNSSPSLTLQVPVFRKWALVAIFLIAFLLTPFGRWLILGEPRASEAITTKETPTRLASALTGFEGLSDFQVTISTNYPNGRYRGTILCGEEQGDFLAWVLDGDNDRPVMLYSRPETLGKDHWAESRRVLDGSSDWWEITGRQQTNLIVIVPERFSKLAERLRRAKEWRTVQDDILLIAVRREPRLPADLMRP